MIGKNYLELKDLENGRKIKHVLGDAYTGERSTIVKQETFYPDKSNVQKNASPSMGMNIHEAPVEQVLAVMEEKGYGWYSVSIYSNPDFGQKELYNSHSSLGSNTPKEIQMEAANEVFTGLTKILSEGKYKMHIFPGPRKDINRLGSSSIALEEIK
jgi:hypothetical protein